MANPDTQPGQGESLALPTPDASSERRGLLARLREKAVDTLSDPLTLITLAVVALGLLEGTRSGRALNREHEGEQSTPNGQPGEWKPDPDVPGLSRREPPAA